MDDAILLGALNTILKKFYVHGVLKGHCRDKGPVLKETSDIVLEARTCYTMIIPCSCLVHALHSRLWPALLQGLALPSPALSTSHLPHPNTQKHPGRLKPRLVEAHPASCPVVSVLGLEGRCFRGPQAPSQKPCAAAVAETKTVKAQDREQTCDLPLLAS